MLLENSNDICNHHRNIQALFTEFFKMKYGNAPKIVESILNKRFNTYNLRYFWYVLESLSYRYPQLWSLLPESLKQRKSKEMLSIGYAVTVRAGCGKFMFKILDFYNVKSYALVKLANLATISKNVFL